MSLSIDACEPSFMTWCDIRMGTSFLCDNSFVLICELLYFLMLLVIIAVLLRIKCLRELIQRHLLIVAGTVFLAGFILYFIGYAKIPTSCLKDADWATLLAGLQTGGRAFLSAFGMFIFDSDFIEVEDIWRSNVVYLGLFALVHVLGVLVSATFILRILGSRFYFWMKMGLFRCRDWICHLLTTGDSHIYVFWGVNEASLTLAKSIKEEYSKDNKKPHYKLLFVETPSESEQDFKEFSFYHFFSSSLHDDIKEQRIRDLDGIIMYPKRRLIEVDREIKEREGKQRYDYFKILDIEALMKVGRRATELRFFFLSEDQQKNIKDTLILKSYLEERPEEHAKRKHSILNGNNRGGSKEVHLYCAARRNDQNLNLEVSAYQCGSNRAEIHIVDDSSLAVMSLKTNAERHPVNYVEVAKDATVETPFNALIMGFGQTGRDAFKFLYEFSTFPTNDKGGDEERSPINITAVDAQMDTIKGRFLAKRPALQEPYNQDRVRFLQMDVHGQDFWDDLRQRAHLLNYIVVAMGNDDLSISLALDVYRFLLRYKTNEDPSFTIFVRCYKKENEGKMEQIEQISERFLKEDNQKNNQRDSRIELFGRVDEIYTYRMVINENTLQEAMFFAYVYSGGIKLTDPWTKKAEEDAKNVWKKRREAFSWEEMFDVRRKEEQDMSNSWHIPTKLQLIRKSTISDEVRDGWLAKRDTETCDYADISKTEREVIDNIAICEHLRWNALSELQGFMPHLGPQDEENKKDVIQMELSCLRPWRKARKGTNEYDSLGGHAVLRNLMKYDYNALDASVYIDCLRRQGRFD